MQTDLSNWQARAKIAKARAEIGGHILWEWLTRPRPTDITEVPRSSDALTVEWLTAVLCRNHPGARVVSMEFGGGSSGSTTRRALKLTYNEAGQRAGLPTLLLSKATPTLTSRFICGLTGALANEVGFYQKIRPELEIEAPAPYYVTYDPRSKRSMLLLEDVTATRGATFCKASRKNNLIKFPSCVHNAECRLRLR